MDNIHELGKDDLPSRYSIQAMLDRCDMKQLPPKMNVAMSQFNAEIIKRIGGTQEDINDAKAAIRLVHQDIPVDKDDTQGDVAFSSTMIQYIKRLMKKHEILDEQGNYDENQPIENVLYIAKDAIANLSREDLFEALKIVSKDKIVIFRGKSTEGQSPRYNPLPMRFYGLSPEEAETIDQRLIRAEEMLAHLPEKDKLEFLNILHPDLEHMTLENADRVLRPIALKIAKGEPARHKPYEDHELAGIFRIAVRQEHHRRNTDPTEVG